MPVSALETSAGTYTWAEDRAQRERETAHVLILKFHLMCSVQTRAVALLSRVAVMCDDDTRLQRVVPYILVSSPLLWRTVLDKLSRVCKHKCSDVLYIMSAVQRGDISLLQTVN